MPIDIDYKSVVQKKIEHVKGSVGRSDPYGRFVLDEAWATKKTADLVAHGETKLQEMLKKAEELGYVFISASVKDFGLVFLTAERNGQRMGGYVDPSGKLILGLKGTKTPTLKISYRRKLSVKELFLQAILKDAGFRR